MKGYLTSMIVALSISAALACTNEGDNTQKPQPQPEPTQPKAERFEVFQMLNPTEGDIPYRIPAITTTRSGRLVAAADYRHSGTDIGVTD